MLNAPQNDERTSPRIDTKLPRDRSLPVLITALARKRHGHPQRDRIVVLIGQCRNYGKFPGMGQRILETIDKLTLVNAEHQRREERG